MEQQKKTCKECGKTKPIGKFWHRKDGTLFDVCKECAWKYIDNKKPNTFLWILKEADVPFIEERWVDLCRKSITKTRTTLVVVLLSVLIYELCTQKVLPTTTIVIP